jgi:hypothetical protein
MRQRRPSVFSGAASMIATGIFDKKAGGVTLAAEEIKDMVQGI